MVIGHYTEGLKCVGHLNINGSLNRGPEVYRSYVQ